MTVLDLKLVVVVVVVVIAQIVVVVAVVVVAQIVVVVVVVVAVDSGIIGHEPFISWGSSFEIAPKMMTDDEL